MGIRPPCCDKQSVKKGLWSAEEDAKLLAYISTHGTGNWTSVPKKAGLKRCGKSCRLRWTNYLRPNLKHEGFTLQEEELIVTLHATMGSRWSIIADQLPGRTDNDVKNYWNTKLSKKLALSGIDPVTHRPISEIKHIITALHFSAAIQSPLLFQPPIPSAALQPQPQKEPEWAHFLAEDAFSSLEEQAAYRNPAPLAADAAPLGGPQPEQPGGSFVEELLHRDWEIMSALVAGHCPL